jgi:hypothetical protein
LKGVNGLKGIDAFKNGFYICRLSSEGTRTHLLRGKASFIDEDTEVGFGLFLAGVFTRFESSRDERENSLDSSPLRRILAVLELVRQSGQELRIHVPTIGP